MMHDANRQYGKVVAHLAAALVSTVAYVAVTYIDPEALRWFFALLVAGNCVAVVAAYLGLY